MLENFLHDRNMTDWNERHRRRLKSWRRGRGCLHRLVRSSAGRTGIGPNIHRCHKELLTAWQTILTRANIMAMSWELSYTFWTRQLYHLGSPRLGLEEILTNDKLKYLWSLNSRLKQLPFMQSFCLG